MNRYAQQTRVLDEIAAKLGVVAYRPDYHMCRGDKNTVMFYLPEDEKHNRMVDRQPFRYTRSEAADRKKYSGIETPKEYVYEDSLWNFENSDRNGHLDMNYANRGTIDLQRSGWEEKVEGYIRLALTKKKQFQYVQASGGWICLQEADETFNEFNREIIQALKQIREHLYLGEININDDARRERICTGEESVFEEYVGQKLYNFCCGFAVPVMDEMLEEMIQDWNRGTILMNHVSLVAQIQERICELGGEHFIWR